MNTRRLVVSALLLAAALPASVYAQAPIPVALVYKEGDTVAGGTIVSLNTPFTDGNGRMASMVAMGTRRIILDENLNVLFDSDTVASPVLTGAEGTMGFSNSGGYIYSPSIDTEDGVFSNGGTLLRGTDPSPGIAGRFITFNSRPVMAADGTAYWVAGTTVTSGGATSQRVIYRNPTPANPAATAIVMKGGDSYGGLTTTAQGLAFDFAVSDNGLHRIHGLTATGVPAANDVYMAADNVVVAQEGMSAPVGNWSATLRVPSINNSGTFVFAGDTTNTGTADEIIVSNTGMVMQEGTVIGGLALSGTCNGLSINNLGDVVFTWGTGATEALFKGPVASLAASAVKLLQVNDQIDTDNDNVADYTVIDFEASAIIGPGFDLGDDGRVFVEVTIRPIGGTSADDVEAILRFPAGGGACNLADITEIGGTTEDPGSPDGQLTVDDIIVFINTFSDSTGCPGANPPNGPACSRADVTGIGGPPELPDGQLTVDDIIAFFNAFSDGC